MTFKGQASVPGVRVVDLEQEPCKHPRVTKGTVSNMSSMMPSPDLPAFFVNGEQVDSCPDCHKRLDMPAPDDGHLEPNFGNHNALVLEAVRQGHSEAAAIAQHSGLAVGLVEKVVRRLRFYGRLAT